MLPGSLLNIGGEWLECVLRNEYIFIIDGSDISVVLFLVLIGIIYDFKGLYKLFESLYVRNVFNR